MLKMLPPVPVSSTRSKIHQSLAGLAVFMVNMTTGMGLGWSSAGWFKITQPGEGPFVATLDEASWIVSLYEIGLPVGSVISGVLLSQVGRRPTLMLAPILCLLGTILMFFATSPAYIYVARFVMSVSFGLDLSCSSLYIGEISTSDLRGVLCTFTSSMVFIGVLLEYCIGPYASYQAQVLMPVFPITVSLLLWTFWAPETPYFLAMKGRTSELHQSLLKLRGVTDVSEVSKEAKEIQKATEEEMKNASTIREFFKSPGNRKGSALVLFLCGTGPLIGTGSLVSYAEYMFKATGSSISSVTSSIIMCSVQVTAGLSSSLVIERLGRRLLLMCTACVNALAMGLIGAYFFIQKYDKETASHISWMPLIAVIVFMVSTNFGTTTVPWVMIGELLPQQSKAFVPSMSVICFSIILFGTNKLFPIVDDRVGLYVAFWVFGVWSLIVATFTFFFVPETRGKTLIEVQELLHSSERVKSSTAQCPENGHCQAQVYDCVENHVTLK